MKKAICLVLVIALVLLGSAITGYTAGSGSHGGGHGGGNWGHGGGHHGSSWGGVWFGSGWGWGGWGPWWWGAGYPSYYPYSYPYGYYPYGYGESPVVVQERAPAYVQPTPRQEEDYYWYFCPDARNYYPYVKKCPSGWLRVVPSQRPPDWKE